MYEEKRTRSIKKEIQIHNQRKILTYSRKQSIQKETYDRITHK